MAERRAFLLREQDRLRQAVVCEPRGHDALVGALLTPPVERRLAWPASSSSTTRAPSGCAATA